MARISCKELTIEFSGNYALENVDLEIPKNSTFGLLGSNGAGKTTLLSLIAGILYPSLGVVTYGSKGSTNPLQQRIGLMPQHAQLPLHQKPLTFLTYIARLKGMDRKAVERDFIAQMEYFGMESYMNKPFRVMSNGMLKIIKFIIAFQGNPDIVLLDEPISGLDPKMSVRVMRYLKEQHGKRTIVICSHHLDIVEEICDHVGVLHQGHVMITSPMRTLRDENHVLTLTLDKVPKALIARLQKISGVRSAFVAEHKNEIRIVHEKDVFYPVIAVCKSTGRRVVHVQRGERLSDFFLKYL